MATLIIVKAYKDDSGFFGPDGANRQISCNHEFQGIWGINTVGEIVPIPSTTVPPSVGTGTDEQQQTVLIPQGNIYTDTTYFNGTDFKTVVKVKDMENLRTTYVDKTSYDTQIIQCNTQPVPSACAIVTNLSAGTPGATTATITWDGIPSAAGYEYVNKTTNVAPTGEGRFESHETIALTGLTTATTYYFFIRTICGPGSNGQSSWTSFSYTTA